MMWGLANLLESVVPNSTRQEVTNLRGNASALLAALVEHQYANDGSCEYESQQIVIVAKESKLITLPKPQGT